MKRIKTVNGYAIYQAVTVRDADKYGCNVGNFNLYLSTDIRDYGLSCSDPQFDDVDSLAVAMELAEGSNFAVAEALAEELSYSTVQDMDLVLEIERRLDGGQTVEEITEAYDAETQSFYAEVDAEAEQEAEAADVVYVVCAYHVGVGEVGRVGTVTAKDEQEAWEKGYGLASERGGYEPDSVTVTVGKRYFFSMDACAEIEAALIHGEDVPELVLFVETPEIVEDFENNENSDWWPVWRCGDYSTEPGFYQSVDEAMEDYASNIGESVYCRVHDC